MNLQQLLDAIQTEKYVTQPLAAHPIAELEEHSREYYALLLAAVLRVRPAIGAAQSRVFIMLLEAMGLANRQAALFERAQNLTAADLSESRRLIAEHNLSQSFLLDTFILLRIEGPLTDDDLRLCAELADLLQVDSSAISALVALALHVLGAATLQAFPDILNPVDCPHWYEFIGEKLTVAKLKNGLAPGLWSLDHPIEITSGWSLENISLFFTKGGQLYTDTVADAKVSIKGCHLINPVLQFKSQTLAFEMQNCKVEGFYLEQARMTAFQFDRLKLVQFKNTSFTTRDARAIHARYTPITFENCQFSACGNRLLVGGALAIRNHDTRDHTTRIFQASHCHFSLCHARLGGALRIDLLSYERTSMSNCIFDKCSATEPTMDYAIYASNIVTSQHQYFIQTSQFKRGYFYFGDRNNSSEGSDYDHVFSDSELINAKLHAMMRYAGEFKIGITMTGNSEILANITHTLPAWTEDF